MKAPEICIERLLAEKTVRNIIVRVGRWDDVLLDIRRSAEERELTDTTLFDMASVTKIVVTTSLALMAIDRGLLSADDPVSRFFPVPEDKRGMTVRHLMTHTMGIGHKSLLGCKEGYGAVAEYVLSIPSDIPIGSDVRYSCPGYILLGRMLEELYGKRLDGAFYEYIAAPLGLSHSMFLPQDGVDFVNSNAKDMHPRVNDYNCHYLGGVCGNAGLFSCLDDMTRYTKHLLSKGAPLFSKETFTLAARNYTEGMAESRGLGYLYVDGRYMQTGGLFRAGSIGHCGHTGQSVFLDPESGLYAIILSDATVSTARKYGKEKYSEVIEMRRAIHASVKETLGF